MSEICEKHNFEELEMHAYTQRFDENGNAIVDDIVYYTCPICEEEESMTDDELKNIAYKEYAESNKKHEKDNQNKSEKHKATDKENKTQNKEKPYLEKYTKFISKITNAPIQPSKAVCQFQISLSLSDAEYENSKSPLHPNLSFMWIAPTSSNKTPIINSGIRKFKNIFPDFTEYSATTGKGLRKDLSASKKPVVKHTIVWDEVGVAMKESKNAGTSDLFEVFSQDFDGLIGAYASIRGGFEKAVYPYACFWLSGVPTFWKDADETFWYQGFGLRTLFLKYEFPETIEPIFDDEEQIGLSNSVFEEMASDLERIKSIKKIKTTPEFMKEYNAYRIANIKAIREVQKDILTSYDPENYPIISTGKFPELWMKLSMIYSASRYNFDENGVLTLELEDLHNAIRDVDEYHENMMVNFHVWQEFTEQKAKVENIKPLEEKIVREIKNLIAKGETYELTRLDKVIKKGDGEINYHAKKSKDGKYVAYPLLLQYVHMKAKNFKEVAETMQDGLKLGWHEASIGENEVKHVTTFYTLIESSKKEEN